MSSQLKILLAVALGLFGFLRSPLCLAVTQEDLNTAHHFEEVSAKLMEPIGRKFLSHDSSFDIQVRFRDAPTVNAYADLVDGKCKVNIYVGIWDDRTGLIRRDSDDEFAAVLSHEIGHCLARHSQLIEKSIDRKIKEYGGPIKNGWAPVPMKSYLELLAENRQFESQADALGVYLMVNAGFNPWAAVKIWERASAHGQQNYNSFYRAHPSAAERADRIREMLEAGKTRQVKGRSPGREGEITRVILFPNLGDS